MGNKITHIDFNGSDRKKAAAWYGDIFDWEITSMDEVDYSMFKSAEGMGGGFSTNEDGKPGIVPYISVSNLRESIDAIVAKGGTLTMDILEMPMVTFALCTDPFGNLIGLVLDPDNA